MRESSSERELIVSTIRRFVVNEVLPVAADMEHRNEYPHQLVEEMRKMGLFGLNVPEEYGGANVDYTTFAMVFEELSKGWLGLAGVIGTHSVLCDVLVRFGTEEQKRSFLPGLASGERRGGICLSEPNAGTDLQNISTVADRQAGGYRVNGSKMWITNGRYGNTFLLLAKTNLQAQPAYAGMSAFVIEKGAPGLTVSRDIDKLGYKSVETCELHFVDFPVPAANLIGGAEGQGFKHVMTGLEAERLNVAARGLGLARAAFEEAILYAQRRTTFGKPIAQHQTIQIKLADMATKIEASRLLIYSAAEKKDRGERCDLEAGMAKLTAARIAWAAADNAVQIHGGTGFAVEQPVSRVLADARILNIFEGAAEIQAQVVARGLLGGRN